MTGPRFLRGGRACPFCSTRAMWVLMARSEIDCRSADGLGEPCGRDLPLSGEYVRWDCPICRYSEIDVEGCPRP